MYRQATPSSSRVRLDFVLESAGILLNGQPGELLSPQVTAHGYGFFNDKAVMEGVDPYGISCQ